VTPPAPLDPPRSHEQGVRPDNHRDEKALDDEDDDDVGVWKNSRDRYGDEEAQNDNAQRALRLLRGLFTDPVQVDVDLFLDVRGEPRPRCGSCRQFLRKVEFLLD